jgi:hypothetical protein
MSDNNCTDSEVGELLSCPDCPDQGWRVDYNFYSGEPEQVQCGFCHANPKSVFNNPIPKDKVNE